MIKIIKSEKLDKIFDAILVYAFAVYIFCMHITESQIFFLPGVQEITLNLPLLVYVYLIFKIIYDLLRGKIDLVIIIGALLASGLLIIMQQSTGSIQFSYFLILFFMIGFKNTDANLFFKSVFWSLFIAFTLIVLLSLMGVIANHPVVQDGGARVRYLLGYDWNNVAHNHFFSIVLFYILYKKDLKIYDYIIIAALNIILFIATTSKCAFICVFATLVIYALINLKKEVARKNVGVALSKNSSSFFGDKMFNIFKYIALASPIILPTIFGVMAKSYSRFSPFLVTIDKLVSGRLNLAHNGFRKWDITLFGQDISMSQGDNYDFVDCSYLNILLHDGLIILLVILLVYFVFIFICIRKYDGKSINIFAKKNVENVNVKETNIREASIQKVFNNKIYKLIILVLFMTLVHSTIEPWFMSLTNFPLIVLFLNISFRDF